MTVAEVERPRRIVARGPRRQVQPHQDASAPGRSSPPPAAATRVRVHDRDRAARCRPTGSWRRFGAAAGSGAAAQGAAAPARRSSRRTRTAAPRATVAGPARRRLRRSDVSPDALASAPAPRPRSSLRPRRAPAAATRRRPSPQAETEGIYLDVGDLKYQVQISRELNPADIEDRDYLKGLPAGDAQPKPRRDVVRRLPARRERRRRTRRRAARRLRDPSTRRRTVYRPVALDPSDQPVRLRRRRRSPPSEPDPGCRTRRPPTARSRARCCSSSSDALAPEPPARAPIIARGRGAATARRIVDLDV